MRDRKLWRMAMAVVAICAVSALVMLLWNALLPDIFGVKTIGFLQALGLLILSKILFGSFGGRGMFGRHGRELRERWMMMSPEQREAFIHQRGMGRRHSHGPWHGRCHHKDHNHDNAARPHTDDNGQV